MLIDEQGNPNRVDKAFSWDAPFSVHGLMHMVISNAHAGDPYPIDVLFLYMANMAWNSSMNTAGVIKMLEDKDPATGEYRIPRIIYSDAYASEMVAYADLVLPDTTYLERHDCISLLDRPISEPDAVQDAIRWPVVEPDRDVRGFQSVLIDLAGRLKLNGFVDHRGRALYKDYADYIVRHERRPGIGPLAGFRGRCRRPHRPRRRQSGPAEALHRKRLVLFRAHPARSAILQARQQGLPGFRGAHGLLRPAAAGHVPALPGIAAEIPAVGRGQARAGRTRNAPPAHPRSLRPAARLVPAVRGSAGRSPKVSAARGHPASGGDVPLMGLDERLAEANPHQERAVRARPDLRRARPRRRRLGRGDLASRQHQGRDRPHRSRQRQHDLDLERDRQARGNMGPRPRRARSQKSLPDEPLDPRTSTTEGRRHALVELRSGDRAGCLVRSARAHREGGARRAERAALSPCRRAGKAARRPDELRYGQEWAK